MGFVTLVIATVAISCGGGDGPNGDSEAPDGATLYSDNCASCHGAGLRGSDEGPPLLSVVYEPNHHSDDGFRSAISKGAPQHHWDFGPMLPVDGLGDAQIGAIIAYVRNEQQQEGFEPYPP